MERQAMGRTIRRVPLNFEWPLNKVWKGFLNPHYKGHCESCRQCDGTGMSIRARYYQDQWYGFVEFSPAVTGSIPFSEEMPMMRRLAQENINRAPEYCGRVLQIEARRLANLFNSRWCHHLNVDDVAALLKADRLWDFTRTRRSKEQIKTVQNKIAQGGNCCPSESDGYIPTPREVNEWSVLGMGHDSINCWICVKDKCRRLGEAVDCILCDGLGKAWDSNENRLRASRWRRKNPPMGYGWQVWETVSEGSPISPVFKTSSLLIDWLLSQGYSREAAEGFVKQGWVPALIVDSTGIHQDIECAAVVMGRGAKNETGIGTQEALEVPRDRRY
ncbi:MAG: hypothetical protein KGI71_06300 [Patescibacteria group bacterium]|nr:hypothetical protein [Patescibacteria group bacterium]